VSARLLLAAAALALLSATGCTIVHRTAGRELPATSDALAIGRTTKSEALARLGPPASVRRQFDGDLLLWRRDELHSRTLLLVPLIPIYQRTDGHSDSDVLALLFDRAGVLAGIGERRDIH
jgi:hypothetical protein